MAQQRRESNRLGFALQLCALRHLGFIPVNLLDPPGELLAFLAEQLGVTPAVLDSYRRQATQNSHLQEIMLRLQFRRATPLDEAALQSWLDQRALEHDAPLLLFTAACTFLQRQHVVRPGITVLERFIGEARRSAHDLTYALLKPLLTDKTTTFLAEVLVIPEGHTRSRFAWLQRSPTDASVSQLKEVLSKLDFLQGAGVGAWDVSAVNPNRLKWLAGVGARSRRQSLLRSDSVKRSCILIAFLHQLLYSATDDAVQMFDQRLWELHTFAKADFERDRRRAHQSINANLDLLQKLGGLLLDTAVNSSDLREKAFDHIARDELSERLQTNAVLLRPEQDAQLDYFRRYHGGVRNVLKPLLKTLSFKSWGEDEGLLAALELVQELHTGKRHRIPNGAPTAFIPEPWHLYLWTGGGIDRYYYELAAAWVLRERLRSGDIYVTTSKRFTPVESYLIPRTRWSALRGTVSELTGTSLTAEAHLKVRLAELEHLALDVEARLRDPHDRGLRVVGGQLHLTRDAAQDDDPELTKLSATIGAGLKPVAITDVLLAVDKETGFSQGFGHLGLQPHDVREELLHLYACLLAQGCNLGFSYMAQSAGLSYHASTPDLSVRRTWTEPTPGWSTRTTRCRLAGFGAGGWCRLAIVNASP